VLSQMKDKSGRIKIDGFYDDVVALRDEERQEFAKLPFNEKKYRQDLGVPKLFGETGFTITDDHEVWTMQEPWGAYSWYAVNDHPSDKALYDFTLSAPTPWMGIANGDLVSTKEVDGLTVLDRWRKEGRRMPVLVLTARDSWSDKVAGLDAGADDYLAKPFQTEELIARLRALIRRASGNASSELNAGDIRLDTRSGKVTKDGEPVKLTAQEYKLLSYLMHHKGKVVSRTELIEHIYDQDFDRDSNTIEVFVTRIRKKLGADVITTIRGLGYTLEDPEEKRG